MMGQGKQQLCSFFLSPQDNSKQGDTFTPSLHPQAYKHFFNYHLVFVEENFWQLALMGLCRLAGHGSLRGSSGAGPPPGTRKDLCAPLGFGVWGDQASLLKGEPRFRSRWQGGASQPAGVCCLFCSVPGSRAGTLLQGVGPALFVSRSNREDTRLRPKPGGSGSGRCLPRLLGWEPR